MERSIEIQLAHIWKQLEQLEKQLKVLQREFKMLKIRLRQAVEV